MSKYKYEQISTATTAATTAWATYGTTDAGIKVGGVESIYFLLKYTIGTTVGFNIRYQYQVGGSSGEWYTFKILDLKSTGIESYNEVEVPKEDSTGMIKVKLDAAFDNVRVQQKCTTIGDGSITKLEVIRGNNLKG